MIPVFDDHDVGGGIELRSNGIEGVEGTERIARSLHEEHRTSNLVQVRVAHPIGPAGRMQRITEKDQPIGLRSLRHDMRCDPSAIRLATEEHALRTKIRPQVIDNLAESAFGYRLPVGGSPSCIHVREVEARDGSFVGREFGCEERHEIAIHPRPGAMRENEKLIGTGTAVEEDGALAGSNATSQREAGGTRKVRRLEASSIASDFNARRTRRTSFNGTRAMLARASSNS